MKIYEQVKDVVGSATVFGEPYAQNGLTLIPASKVSVGAGGGEGADNAQGSGFGLDARPVGAFVIKGDEVSWVPAIDVNRIVLITQIGFIVALLTIRSVTKALARRRR